MLSKRIYTKVVTDMLSGEIIEELGYNYVGEIALCESKKGQGDNAADPTEGDNLLNGGPGDANPPSGGVGEPSGTQPPAATYKIAGREFSIEDPELLAALADRDEGVERKLGDSSQELGDLREFKRSIEQTTTPPVEGGAGDYDYSTLLFTDPAGSLNKFKNDLIEEITGMYNANESQKAFWKGFYSDNEDLVGSEFLVESVLNKNMQSWEKLLPSDASKKLADASREHIIKFRRSGNTGTGGGGDIFEGPSTKTKGAPKKKATIEGDELNVTVTRNPGEGDLIGINFVIGDKGEKTVIRGDIDLDELGTGF